MARKKKEVWPAGALPKGTRVRFLVDGLGASERDSLFCVTEDRFGMNDTGIVDFPHPNQKACKGFVYVLVRSKSEPLRELFVGVSPNMIEKIT